MKNLTAILTLLLFSSSVFATEDCVTCPEFQQNEVFSKEKLDNISKALRWWGASENNVKNAFCRKPKPVTDAQVKSKFKSKYPNSGKPTTVGKFSFSDSSPEMIDLFEKLVPHKTATKGNDCKDVMCALEAILGKTIAPKLAYMLDTYGVNGSHLMYSNADAWKVNDLNTVIKGFGDFPDFLYPFHKNKQFSRFKKGYTRGDGGTVANAVMEFFDPFFDESSEYKNYTVFHEFGHFLGTKLDLDDSAKWKSFSKWETKDGVEKPQKTDNFPSNYAKTNHAEDFAESVSTYRYNPAHLKKVAPKKYQFIKESIFMGIEYTSKESCKDKNRYDNKLKEIMSAPNYKPNEILELQTLKDFSVCKDQLLNHILGDASQKEMDTCLRKVIAFNDAKFDISKLKPAITNISQFHNALKNYGDINDLVSEEKFQKRKEDILTEFSNKFNNALHGVSNTYYSADSKALYNKDKKAFCKKETKYSYQNFEFLDKDFGDSLTAYHQKKNINALSSNRCLKSKSFSDYKKHPKYDEDWSYQPQPFQDIIEKKAMSYKDVFKFDWMK
jgi:hypothetical protein